MPNAVIEPRPIKVGVDRLLVHSNAEVRYVFRTLLRVAGYPYKFIWVDDEVDGETLDIYYGLRGDGIAATISIAACGKQFADAQGLEPSRLYERGGLAFLDFGLGHDDGYCCDNTVLRFSNDVIFASYWLLTGACESQYSRDRWDNLNLEGSFFLKNSLASKPLVSLYASSLRKHFQQLGYPALEFPWISPQARAAFVFTHDVDYPQMIRWIECLRLLGARGLKSLSSIGGVLRGTNHFWKFAEWVDFEKELGTRPTFYFMARKGSLLQYARGTPDAFYDIETPVFGRLFNYLDNRGCELGLHASYEAYRSVEQLRREKEALEQATGVGVVGNRHHYWHLDPLAAHETLRRHEQACLLYDSSLAFEFYPGFRRGICHPFRVYHPGERRELHVVELPVAWMDDHFDRRVAQNQISQPVAYAQKLVEVAQATYGVIVVDYHVRGMNHDFYPRYGSWLMNFIQNHLGTSISFCTAGELAKKYIAFEEQLDTHSQDLTEFSL